MHELEASGTGLEVEREGKGERRRREGGGCMNGISIGSGRDVAGKRGRWRRREVDGYCSGT